MTPILDSELFGLFVSESRELIEEVEPKLILLNEISENTGAISPEILNAIFRLFHSIKGSAGSLSLSNMAAVNHEAETYLDLLRSGKTNLTADSVDMLLKAVDMTRLLLEEVERTGSDQKTPPDFAGMVERLRLAVQTSKSRGSRPKPIIRLDDKEAMTSSPTEPAPPALPTPPEQAIPAATALGIPKTLVDRFTAEAQELLESAEKILLEMMQQPHPSPDAKHDLFGILHTFKGTCGFMGYPTLEEISHRIETTLEPYVFGEKEDQPLAPEEVMTYLIICDGLKSGVMNVIEKGSDQIPEIAKLVDLLEANLGSTTKTAGAERVPLGQILVEQGEVSPEQLGEALEKQRPPPLGEILIDMGATTPESVSKALTTQMEQTAEPRSFKKGFTRQDIRVDLRKLDSLVNLVGELVIAEAMVTRNPELENLQLETFDRAVHLLRRVTGELQDVAMSIRMVPLATTFQKLIRIVHDLARRENKKVKLDILGEETEVDKTMAEKISDPLLHMVRNAVDHGIEPPEERLRQGKPETGKVTVEGRHEGGEVWIVIADDGRGLDRARILAKARERGLFSGSDADLSDEDVFRFIFEPGFSTADKVTEVSGRGVGMDVVKKNIEKLKGRITIRNNAGHGSTFILQIPLTMAIIDGMLVRVGTSCYTIPLLSIRESLRPTRKMLTRTPDGLELVRIREELIPVIRLHAVFRKAADHQNLEDGILIIVQDRETSAGLFVDEILGQHQTVIKGLSKYLGSAHGVSGCTILGDGRVSLILDVSWLVSQSETTGHHEEGKTI